MQVESHEVTAGQSNGNTIETREIRLVKSSLRNCGLIPAFLFFACVIRTLWSEKRHTIMIMSFFSFEAGSLLYCTVTSVSIVRICAKSFAVLLHQRSEAWAVICLLNILFFSRFLSRLSIQKVNIDFNCYFLKRYIRLPVFEPGWLIQPRGSFIEDLRL